MRQHSANLNCLLNTLFLFLAWMIVPIGSLAADKLVALYSAHAIPYAMPWVAEELGLFKNVEVGLLGGVAIVNAYINGATDLVFIGSIKNIMTQSVLAKPDI